MHLKNYSMFLSEMGWVLSPFYDLLNVKLILPKDQEDTALLLGGKKKNFNKGYFDRLGAMLQLNDKQINAVHKQLMKWLPKAIALIESSFLDAERQHFYQELITKRVAKLTANS
jgi:serine/threonine-protein kinase HipA